RFVIRPVPARPAPASLRQGAGMNDNFAARTANDTYIVSHYFFICLRLFQCVCFPRPPYNSVLWFNSCSRSPEKPGAIRQGLSGARRTDAIRPPPLTANLLTARPTIPNPSAPRGPARLGAPTAGRPAPPRDGPGGAAPRGHDTGRLQPPQRLRGCCFVRPGA